MIYTITYDQPHHQNIKITATFNTNGVKEMTLNFPAWRPGRYKLGNFSKNITQFKVNDDLGNILNHSKTNTHTWKIDTENSRKIIVSYYYYAAELNAGSSFMNSEQLYVNPVNCLIYNETQIKQPCEVMVNIPKDFEIASGLPFNNGKLTTHDYHELVDTPFIASPTLQHYNYKIGPLSVHLWFQGDCKIDWPRVKNDFIKFTRAQINAFTKIPIDDYHFIYQITPYKVYHGVEHAHSTVIALGPTYELMNKLYNDFLGVSSHEFYHTWNIKNIRPKEMSPYNYSKENFSRLGFVTEGVTTYMGDLFLSYSKVREWAWYKSELEKLLLKHFENFGRFNYSVGESSWDTWLDGYVKGVPNRKVSIYNEGALLAFTVDMKIRVASGNRLSLHDAMQQLYLKFGGLPNGYSEKDYIDTISQFTNTSENAFFDKYAFTANSYESILVEALDACGLELNTQLNTSFDQRILGIKTSSSIKGAVVTDIIIGSSADLATVMIGDTITAINNFSVQSNLSDWVKYSENDQITLTIDRNRNIINLICPHTNRTYYPTYYLTKLKIPSSLQKRIFKKWCGYNFES